jgi:histidine triad (HIT) family protein
VARAVQAALAPDGIRIMQFNEAPAGQSVFHLHMHVIPVYEGDALQPHATRRADDTELADLARAIAARL